MAAYLGWDLERAPALAISPNFVAAVQGRQTVQERSLVRAPYPNFKVVVLNDEVNTFEHVVDCLVRYIPAMQPDQAWELAHRIDQEGVAIVWSGPQEQAELYHQQLGAEGLTMAPLEAA
ncbi:ATP-dependent Clp protease adapter ClpS [Cyanobium sp. WAJ14-Wanaka]|uniref:ATP-dependent Clp protease adapter ClpS n=1 Tax=Cyanobium sp. WAJ14-Wanaka TaxID=2823725 RepID=UPI0028F456B0|nr:ATP-dependent Clp protease adapter ClpS [Cyanobium sp. WAJ14-Wanaka]MCP9774474.1 ATP-dependent Clp protease adapter ClpS [Cyanobium sp. WAJ14-Wanaka]